MSLPDGVDGIDCLEHCRAKRGCRFVSYSLDTGLCSGFNRSALPMPIPDEAHTLLVVSRKRFRLMPGIDYPGDDLFPNIATKDPNVCPQLCHIYPTCNVVIYSPPYGGCWLKAKGRLNPVVIKDTYSEKDFPGIKDAITNIS